MTSLAEKNKFLHQTIERQADTGLIKISMELLCEHIHPAGSMQHQGMSNQLEALIDSTKYQDKMSRIFEKIYLNLAQRYPKIKEYYNCDEQINPKMIWKLFYAYHASEKVLENFKSEYKPNLADLKPMKYSGF